MDYEKAYNDICQDLMKVYNSTSSIEVRMAIKKIHPKLKDEVMDKIYENVLAIKKHGIKTYLGLDIDSVIACIENELDKNKQTCGEVNHNDSAFQEQLQIWFDKGRCSGRDDVINNPEEFGLRKAEHSIEEVAKEITKDKETATKFLKSAGIMDENGELAEIYRSSEAQKDKPAGWAKEDEMMLKIIISDYEAASKSFCGHQGKLNWLKSLPERLGTHNEIVRKEICSVCGGNGIMIIHDHYKDFHTNIVYEDMIERKCTNCGGTGYIEKHYNCGHWKPTEHQIFILWDAISNLKHDEYKHLDELKSLYNEINGLGKKKDNDENMSKL